MVKKLFVGGLSWDTTDVGLRRAFVLHGEVAEAKVITDRETGHSWGLGFATFFRDEDAKQQDAEDISIRDRQGSRLTAWPTRF